MIQQGLAPGVKDGRDADLRLEPLFAEGEQGGAGAGKEQVVKRPLVLGDERVEHVGKGEDDVKIGHRSRLSHCFCSHSRLPPAGSLGSGGCGSCAGRNDPSRSPRSGKDVRQRLGAQSSKALSAFQRRREAGGSCPGGPPSARRHPQPLLIPASRASAAVHSDGCLGPGGRLDQIQGLFDLRHPLVGNMQIDRGGLQVAVAEAALG